MTLTVRKNGESFPTLMSDFWGNDRLFGSDFFDLEKNMLKLWDVEARIPSANIIENGKDYKIELAAPGLEKKDFKVEVDKGYLTISTEKKEEKKEEKENFKRREFSYSAFSRSFLLPQNVITDKVDAKYENGILKLSILKKEVDPSKSAKEIKVS